MITREAVRQAVHRHLPTGDGGAKKSARTLGQRGVAWLGNGCRDVRRRAADTARAARDSYHEFAASFTSSQPPTGAAAGTSGAPLEARNVGASKELPKVPALAPRDTAVPRRPGPPKPLPARPPKPLPARPPKRLPACPGTRARAAAPEQVAAIAEGLNELSRRIAGIRAYQQGAAVNPFMTSKLVDEAESVAKKLGQLPEGPADLEQQRCQLDKEVVGLRTAVEAEFLKLRA